MDMYIPSNENQEWFDEEPHTKEIVTHAYKEVIPDILSDISSDHRVMINDHLLNSDFRDEPKFIAGFHQKDDGLIILGCLYVYPKFRNRGYGKHVVQQLQEMAQNNPAIQISVYERMLGSLSGFYNNLGFVSTEQPIQDPYGKTFIDFFWSPRPINIQQAGNGWKIKPLLPS